MKKLSLKSTVSKLNSSQDTWESWLTLYIYYSGCLNSRKNACEKADAEIAQEKEMQVASFVRLRQEAGIVGKNKSSSWFTTVISLTAVYGSIVTTGRRNGTWPNGPVFNLNLARQEAKQWLKLTLDRYESIGMLKVNSKQKEIDFEGGKTESAKVTETLFPFVNNPTIQSKSEVDLLKEVGHLANEVGGLGQLQVLLSKIDSLGGNEKIILNLKILQDLKSLVGN